MHVLLLCVPASCCDMTSRTKNEQGLQFPTVVNLIFTVVILVSGRAI